MDPTWIPIIFTALIVFGVVGGQLAHEILTRLLPLLEAFLQDLQNRRLPGAHGSGLLEDMAHLKEQVSRLETRDHELQEQVAFLETLLESPRRIPGSRHDEGRSAPSRRSLYPLDESLLNLD